MNKKRGVHFLRSESTKTWIVVRELFGMTYFIHASLHHRKEDESGECNTSTLMFILFQATTHEEERLDGDRQFLFPMKEDVSSTSSGLRAPGMTHCNEYGEMINYAK